jgi:chromosome segregation ATPase
MNDARFMEILNEVKKPEYHIELADNPLQMGPGYVSSKVNQILSVLEKVNEFASEVALDLSKDKNELNDLDSELKLRTRKFLLALTKEETEGMNSDTKKQLAQQKANQAYVQDWVMFFRARNQPVPQDIADLDERIRLLTNKIESLKALVEILSNKREHCSKQDSGVRLQARAIENELKLYGTAPNGSTFPSGSSSGLTPRPATDSMSGESREGLVGSSEFNNLTQ